MIAIVDLMNNVTVMEWRLVEKLAIYLIYATSMGLDLGNSDFIASDACFSIEKECV